MCVSGPYGVGIKILEKEHEKERWDDGFMSSRCRKFPTQAAHPPYSIYIRTYISRQQNIYNVFISMFLRYQFMYAYMHTGMLGNCHMSAQNKNKQTISTRMLPVYLSSLPPKDSQQGIKDAMQILNLNCLYLELNICQIYIVYLELNISQINIAYIELI